ncbi:MAG: lipid II flippase MurJ, partial [Chloroflexota bacterium]
AVQVPALLRLGVRYEPILTVTQYGVGQVLRLMAPRLLGLSFSYFNRTALGIISQPLAGFAFTALTTSFQVMMVPVSFLGQSLGIAAFPTLAGMAANDDDAGIRRLLNTALRSIFFLGLPMTLGLMLIRQPLSALLFERGEFGPDSTVVVAAGLLFYALAIIPVAMLEVLARTFYALKDTWTPVIAGFIQILGMMGLGALFAYTLFPGLGLIAAAGLAFAFAVSNWVEVGVLIWLLRRRLQRLELTHLLDGLWRMTVAVVGMGLVVWASLLALAPFSPFIEVVIAAPLGAAAYFASAYLLRLEEVTQLIGVLLRRLRR